MNKIKIFILIAVTFLLVLNCISNKQDRQKSTGSLVNTAHLDSLYEEIIIGNKPVGIIHIYSEYPDYNWVADEDEGIACVDDATRAAVFYLKHYSIYADELSLVKAKKLFKFILYMQSDNGFFYNFIFNDYLINKEHRNSRNKPDWWSWRAMWALSNGYNYFLTVDKEFAEIIYNQLERSIKELKKIILSERVIKLVNGKEMLTWLPDKSASDQASLIVLSLLNYYKISKDETIHELINTLCNGILIMQKGDSTKFPYNAFLSWENLWHGYGNLQSYSLLKASPVLKRKDLLSAALSEIKYFYKYLKNENYLSSFIVAGEGNEYKQEKIKQFSQIAYNFRVIIYACLEAYNVTDDSTYAILAGETASWFFGNNIANAQMYFPSSGICYDGIESKNSINKNSGAESTIEALLSLIAIEQNKFAMSKLEKVIAQKKVKF